MTPRGLSRLRRVCLARPKALDRFFVPPYVGPSGWVGVWLDENTDWAELADGWRLVAPKRLVERLPSF